MDRLNKRSVALHLGRVVINLPITTKGDKGMGVRLAQSILKDSGVPTWDPGAIDGGPQTGLAVKNFQTDVTLTADGIVGENIWRALWS
jgi:peptidoglycan hydrolase-like protein with peptidoglycan-binding domain